MKKAQEVYTDIIKDKNRSKILVYGVCALAGAISIFCMVFAYSVYIDSTNHLYSVEENGNVSRLEKVKLITELPESAKFQCSYLFSTYYTYTNDNMEQKRESGLRLMEEKDGLQLEKKWEKWFKGIKDQILSQETLLDESTFSIEKINSKVYKVKAAGIISVYNNDLVNTYKLTIQSSLRVVERSFPYNPHGFIFFNFKDKIEPISENKLVY